jgi:D-serine deaminase-like pyridoxal phosphate-dependent protein
LPAGDGASYGACSTGPTSRWRACPRRHGILDLRETDWRPRVGDVVRIVPNHVCIVVHLNDMIHGVRGLVVESTWPVSARGRAPLPG